VNMSPKDAGAGRCGLWSSSRRYYAMVMQGLRS